MLSSPRFYFDKLYVSTSCKSRHIIMVHSIVWKKIIIKCYFVWFIIHTYKHAVLSIVEIHVVASYYRQEKHLEEVEQCTRTHAALISSMKTRGDLENIFIHDMSRAIPINRSAAEVETSIFTSFKGVPVWLPIRFTRETPRKRTAFYKL